MDELDALFAKIKTLGKEFNDSPMMTIVATFEKVKQKRISS